MADPNHKTVAFAKKHGVTLHATVHFDRGENGITRAAYVYITYDPGLSLKDAIECVELLTAEILDNYKGAT